MESVESLKHTEEEVIEVSLKKMLFSIFGLIKSSSERNKIL